eukprot:6180717-Pleurochrysis_carterae.AAC.2
MRIAEGSLQKTPQPSDSGQSCRELPWGGLAASLCPREEGGASGCEIGRSGSQIKRVGRRLAAIPGATEQTPTHSSGSEIWPTYLGCDRERVDIGDCALLVARS